MSRRKRQKITYTSKLLGPITHVPHDVVLEFQHKANKYVYFQVKKDIEAHYLKPVVDRKYYVDNVPIHVKRAIEILRREKYHHDNYTLFNIPDITLNDNGDIVHNCNTWRGRIPLAPVDVDIANIANINDLLTKTCVRVLNILKTKYLRMCTVNKGLLMNGVSHVICDLKTLQIYNTYGEQYMYAVKRTLGVERMQVSNTYTGHHFTYPLHINGSKSIFYAAKQILSIFHEGITLTILNYVKFQINGNQVFV